MAKKVKLPLDMGNDVKVRTIEELKEHYNSEKIIENYLNGQLIQWLNDRGYDYESDQIKDINGDDKAHLAAELAKVFEITLEDEVDVEAIEERKERMNKLREYTSDDDILENVDIVAFSQEDMADIVNDSDIIYLCGKEFTVSYKKEGKKYIGVNNPTVIIKSQDIIDLESKNITVENCTFSESTLANMKKSEPVPEQNSGDHALSKKFTGLESEIISSDITVERGETLRFENKEIHIRANIECSGTIEFENCIVHYNEINDTGINNTGIKMSGEDEPSIEISNCRIIGHGYESSFINTSDRCRINAEYTEFIDCCNLAGNYVGSCEYGKVSFEKCKFRNCLSVVFFYGNLNFMINDCIIIFDDVPDYYKKPPRREENCLKRHYYNAFDRFDYLNSECFDHTYEIKMFSTSSARSSSEKSGSAKNTMVKVTENFKLNSESLIFKSDNRSIADDVKGLKITIFDDLDEINRCTFCGVSGGVSCCQGVSIISSSVFTECSGIYLYQKNCLKSLDDCIFDKCSEIMVFNHNNGANIRNCQFINCTNRIIGSYPTTLTIENCSFINITIGHEHWECLEIGAYSKIINCTFNGIKIIGNYGRLLSYPHDSAATFVTISYCEFRNCTTKNGDGNIDNFIRTEGAATVKTLFSERQERFTAVQIENCEGLDKLDCEGDTADDYTIRYEDKNGERIGADIDPDSITADMV